MGRFWLLCAFLGLVGCAGGLTIDKSHPSVNFDSREQLIVLHYTSTDLANSLAILTKGEVSSHYLIGDSPATVYQLVDESKRAWHVGDSQWKGRTWLNSSSIGIEMVNRGYTDGPQGRQWYPYPEEQIEALIVLLKDIMQRHGLKPGAIVGHSDIAPQRKLDPGPLLPWKRLADAGLVPWPQATAVARWLPRFSSHLPDMRWWQNQLSQFGYRVEPSGVLDQQTRNVIAAFQMRYRPSRYDGQPDAETAALLAVLNSSSQ